MSSPLQVDSSVIIKIVYFEYNQIADKLKIMCNRCTGVDVVFFYDYSELSVNVDWIAEAATHAAETHPELLT